MIKSVNHRTKGDKLSPLKPAVVLINGLPCSNEECQYVFRRYGWILSDEELKTAAGAWPETCPRCGVEQNLPAIFSNKQSAVMDLPVLENKPREVSKLNRARLKVITFHLCSARQVTPEFHS